MATSVELDRLLAETRWLAQLARRLVGNAEDAEEVVQDSLHAATRRPPRSPVALRSWLGRIVRNRAIDVMRARRSRRADGRLYERSVAGGTAAPATADVVARAEVHERLVRAVRELKEPYRTTVLLRFFDQLTPRDIAARQGIPVATVHSRLQRALAQLRATLAGVYGAEWPLVVAPLGAAPPWMSSTLLLGVSLMKIVLASFFALAAVAVVVLVRGEDQAVPASRAAAERQTAAAEPATSAGGPAVRGAHRIAVDPMTSTPESAAGTAAAAAVVVHRGRVIDVHGDGIPGVALSAGLGTSAAGGTFTFEADIAADRVRSTDRRWATVLAGSTRVTAGNVSTVVVAPQIALGGRVVDSDGRPLTGAAVTVHPPAHLGADLGVLLDYSVTETWRTQCDAAGRFLLSEVPAIAGASLSAELGGYLPAIMPLPQAGTTLLELTLDSPGEGASLVRGIVVDAFGATIAGARISAGRAVSRSDERGEFTVDLATGGGQHLGRIVAVAPGMQPAVYTPPAGSDGAPSWPDRVVLRLGGAPLAIAGVVVDASGRPFAGARVWIADPLVIGSDGDVVLAESVLAERTSSFWAFVETDDHGRFCLEGLADRPYEVRAVDPRTLVGVTVPAVRAGATDCAIALDAPMHAELRGRVLARDGSPIVGVSVMLQRPALEVQVPTGTRDEWLPTRPVTTGEDGGFRFENVPRSGVEAFAIGDAIQFAGRMIEPGCDPADFVIEVDRRVHLQVELAVPHDRADAVRVLGRDGRAMLLRIMRGRSAKTNRSAAIVDGRTEVIALGEGAVTAVFYRGEVEVGRMPLALRVGPVNTVVF